MARQTVRSQKKVPAGSAKMPQTIVRRVMSQFTGSDVQEIDIIDLIKEDHKCLKDLIKIMKSDDATFAEKKAAFKRFVPIVTAHAKPEGATWYAVMKRDAKLKGEGLEGDVEHELVDQLCAELKRTTGKDLFMAKLKVLGEFLEHHIEEEEEDMLPDYKKNSTAAERAKLGAKYLKLRSAYLTQH